MLDEKDLQAIAQLMDQKIGVAVKDSESRMMAYFESAILPRFDFLADGIQDIQEKLVPRSRVDDLEEEVRFLKTMFRQMSEDVQQLKEAN